MKNFLHLSLFTFLVLFFYACNKAPEESFIKDSIYNRYSMMGLAAGAGTWSVHQIDILSINKTKNEKEWEVKALVSGHYENNSLPESYNNAHDFTDTLKLVFFKQNSKTWQYRDY